MISQFKQRKHSSSSSTNHGKANAFCYFIRHRQAPILVKLIDLVALTSFRKRLSLICMHENSVELQLTCRFDQTFKKAELVSLTFTYLQTQHNLKSNCAFDFSFLDIH